MFFLNSKLFITAAAAITSVLLTAADLNFNNELKVLKSWQKQMIVSDAKVNLGGAPSIRLQNKGIISKILDLDPNARYELTYYVKGKDDGRTSFLYCFMCKTIVFVQRIGTSN